MPRGRSAEAPARGELLPPRLRALAAGRGPVALCRTHGPGCPACRDYADRLTAREAAAGEWGGRIRLLAAEEGAGESPLLVVADEWGEVYFAAQPGPDHDFPAPEEVVEWLRFAAIQCPECEGPEGEWRTL